MAARKIHGLRVIITGASSGIGRALAVELARQGARLILTARRADRLQSLLAELTSLPDRVAIVAGDITDPATHQRLMATATREFGGLDVLVNNAGIGAIGPFMEADETRLRRIMEVNFFAPLAMTRAAVPLLRDGVCPLIVNVSSVLGHRAVANKSEYCASKFALHGFSDALRCELTREGIDILLASPSTTSSEFFDQAIDGSATRPHRRFRAMSPQRVAIKTVRAMQRGQHEIILSAGGKALVWLDRLCPTLMNQLLARFS